MDEPAVRLARLASYSSSKYREQKNGGVSRALATSCSEMDLGGWLQYRREKVLLGALRGVVANNIRVSNISDGSKRAEQRSA